MTAIAAGEDAYIAAAVTDDRDRPLTSIWLSSDLENWVRATFEQTDLTEVRIRDLAATQDRFVAVGAGIWTSEDGQDWTPVDVGEVMLETIESLSIGLVAVGSSGGDESDAVVMTSVDGVTWTRSPSVDLIGEGPQRIDDVIDLANGVLAVGTDAGGPALWTSSDGLEWQRIVFAEGRNPFEGGGFVISATAGGPGVVIVGVGGELGFGPAVWVGLVAP